MGAGGEAETFSGASYCAGTAGLDVPRMRIADGTETYYLADGNKDLTVRKDTTGANPAICADSSFWRAPSDHPDNIVLDAAGSSDGRPAGNAIKKGMKNKCYM